MANLNIIAPEYRYFTTDLLSNTLLAEIPFTDVSYERALKGAGAFSGKIPILPKTSSPIINPLDLYEATMPGKTALYVMRDGICVWGGIIWSRQYNLVSRDLQVSASEFTSYFQHRNVWKTWTHDFGATLTVAGEVGTVALDPGFSYLTAVSSSIKVSFRDVGNFAYDGFYTVTAVASQTQFTIDAIGIPNGTYPLTTILVRTDTYDWVRSLIDATLSDFTGYEFANDEIEPGVATNYTVVGTQLSSGYATITTLLEHDISPGKIIIIRNVDPAYNGQYIVTDVPTPLTFKYQKAGANAGLVARSVNTKSIVGKLLVNYLATLLTSTAHGYSVGQRVFVTNVDAADSISEILNGEFIITSVTTFAFSYLTAGVKDIKAPGTGINGIAAVPVISSGGISTVTPYVISGSYGPWTSNSDIGIEYSTMEYSGVDLDPPSYRGFELKNVGAELDRYSDQLPTKKRKTRTPSSALNRINGFEYRVDCEYDPNTASFKRIFVLLPINYPDPPAEGEVSPISRFGADQLVFEYPGNISDIQIDEKADQSATRFWIQGNDSTLGDGASQPYAAASSTELLLQGWPILDLEHAEQDILDEGTLFDYGLRYLSEVRPPTADITVSVNGSLAPVVGDYYPGDWCSLILDDEFVRMRLASDLEPRDTAIVRKIDSFSVSVPNSPTFPEKVSLKLIAEWEVDKRG
jgi:hypothetical protein